MKRLFIFVLIYLPLQYAVVGIVGLKSSEPWPAFVFPGFKSVYVYGDSYQLNDFVLAVEINDNRLMREFTPRQFFYEIPNSQLAGFVRTNLESAVDIRAFDSSTRKWFHERGNELLGTPARNIYYVHRRRHMTRIDGRLKTDSVKVVKRVRIAEVAD
ncbi:hypothetical protein [Rhodohalobacter sp. 8-1]|uniref:hypothetical protein n=1 Tax=Rhodohalobacter sp. 8-1 TaxID=3131972 RepID=UPI0030EC5B73